MKIEVEQLKQFYYEYVGKIPNGLSVIVQLFQISDYESALHNLGNFAEGLESLLTIEEKLAEQGFFINSRIQEATVIFEKINRKLEDKQYKLLSNLLKEQLIPIFSSATEWQFSRQ